MTNPINGSRGYQLLNVTGKDFRHTVATKKFKDAVEDKAGGIILPKSSKPYNKNGEKGTIYDYKDGVSVRTFNKNVYGQILTGQCVESRQKVYNEFNTKQLLGFYVSEECDMDGDGYVDEERAYIEEAKTAKPKDQKTPTIDEPKCSSSYDSCSSILDF